MLHPAGELSLTGLSQTVTFYKSAMDRIGVHVDLVRIGAFKGAMEPFVMTEQSPDVRANKNRLLDDVFARVVSAIAADRTARRPPDGRGRGARADRPRPVHAGRRRRSPGSIDGIADEGRAGDAHRAGARPPDVGIRDPDPAPVAPGAWPGRRVAVVLVDGDDRRRPEPGAAVRHRRRRRLGHAGRGAGGVPADATVGAVVLRVNSPGGSAFASDVDRARDRPGCAPPASR